MLHLTLDRLEVIGIGAGPDTAGQVSAAELPGSCPAAETQFGIQLRRSSEKFSKFDG